MSKLDACTIVVLGASGLIGSAVAGALQRRGFRVISVARRFPAAQRGALRESLEAPVVDLDAKALTRLLARCGAAVTVNCIGVLQDGRSGSIEETHSGFAARL